MDAAQPPSAWRLVLQPLRSDDRVPCGPGSVARVVDLVVIECHRCWPSGCFGLLARFFGGVLASASMFWWLFVPQLPVKAADFLVHIGADALGFAVYKPTQPWRGYGEVPGEVRRRVAECDEALKATARAACVAPFAA
jgi:hypothetical protein